MNQEAKTLEIKYRACTPAGAPTAPTCGPIVTVHTDPQALGVRRAPGKLAAQDFSVTTTPQHDHRVDTNGTETYVVWARCTVPLVDEGAVCPETDVVMKASRNNGATWSALTCVNCQARDQFFPAIKTDRSRQVVNIALYSSWRDSTFQRRVRVNLYQINPGRATPDSLEAHVITTRQSDPSQDPLLGGTNFGASIGVAARGTGRDGGSRAYVHYTYNTVEGIYNGVKMLEQNNHLSRLDY